MRELLRRAGLVVGLAAALMIGLWLAPFAATAQSGISAPAAGSTVTGDVAIMGTAVIEPFQKYELHYKIEPSGDDAYVYFDGNTSPVINGQLGTWRAAGLPQGTYTLRLRVVKTDGNYAEFVTPNLNVNQGPPPTPTAITPTVSATPETPTPTFTPGPTATPIVGVVQQPQLGVAPTPTPAAVALPAPADPAAAALPAATSVAVVPVDLGPGQGSTISTTASAVVVDPAAVSGTRALGEALSLARLRRELARGMRFSAALFLLAVAVYGGKRIFDWARRKYG